MAKLRYIGARYVPRFVGPFLNTQTYEALDVVWDENEVQYISKIPVPEGSSLLDTTYWIPYIEGMAIADLQNQINDINTDISDMKDGNVSGSLQNQINDINTDISDMKDGNVSGSLQEQINTNASDISDMKDGSVSGSLQEQINTNASDIADMKDGNISGSLQEQINNLASKIVNFTITHGNSTTITLIGGTRAVLFSPGNAPDLSAIFTLSCDMSGVVRCDKVSTSDNSFGTGIAVSTGSYTVTLTNNSAVAAQNSYILILSGNVTI